MGVENGKWVNGKWVKKELGMETVKGKKRSKKFGAAQRGEMEMTGQSGTWRGGVGK